MLKYRVNIWVGVSGLLPCLTSRQLYRRDGSQGREAGAQPKAVTASPSGVGLRPTKIKTYVQKKEGWKGGESKGKKKQN